MYAMYKYYIQKYLEIIHTKGKCYIELYIRRSYFSEFNKLIQDPDSDTEKESNEINIKYNELLEKYIDLVLTPRSPILIYDNNEYINSDYKIKYHSIIIDKIKNNIIDYLDTQIPCTNFEDIISINKIELMK